MPWARSLRLPAGTRRPGTSGRHEQLALGETPNVAARFLAFAEPDRVVVSAATCRLVDGSPLRPSDAPGSAPGGGAQAEVSGEEGGPAQDRGAEHVNVAPDSVGRARRLVAGLLLAALSAGCAAVTESPSRGVEIADLVSNAAAFDGKVVTVAGQVADVELRGGGLGARLGRVFKLTEGSHVVKVVSTVGPTCRAGSTATVNGRFSQRNGLVDATWVVCSPG
jgi:hypothetical protein